MKKTRSSTIILPYRKATVYKGAKDCYINLVYWSLVEKKYLREKIRIKEKYFTRAEKYQMLDEACKKLNVELAQRNLAGIYHESVINKISSSSTKTVIEWLSILSEDTNVSSDRKEIGNSFVGILNELSIIHPLYENLEPKDIDQYFIENMVTYLQSLGRAGKTINKYLSFLEFLTEWLADKKALPEKIKTNKYRVSQPKNETGRFPLLTNEEMEAVFKFYKDWNEGHYYLFLLHVHYSCIRPGELHRLQIEHYNFENRSIFIPWYHSKNGLSRHVQILEPLYQALIRAGVDKLPKKFFLFGPSCKPGLEQNFNEDYTSEVWANNRKKIGLSKEKQLYGLKHTFNTNYINNNKSNPDWEWLRRHNRHATIQQTQSYIAELAAYYLDEKKHTIKDFTDFENRNAP